MVFAPMSRPPRHDPAGRLPEAVGAAVREVGGLFVPIASLRERSGRHRRQSRSMLISAPERLERFPVLRPGGAGRTGGSGSTPQPAPVSPATPRSGCRSWRRSRRGSHAYHATMPTDAPPPCATSCWKPKPTVSPGARNRRSPAARFVPCWSPAASRASPPKVSGAGSRGQLHHRRGHSKTGRNSRHGVQTAAGVPLMCDEPADFRTFRIGLFGLEKLHNPERSVENFRKGPGRHRRLRFAAALPAMSDTPDNTIAVDQPPGRRLCLSGRRVGCTTLHLQQFQDSRRGAAQGHPGPGG